MLRNNEFAENLTFYFVHSANFLTFILYFAACDVVILQEDFVFCDFSA